MIFEGLLRFMLVGTSLWVVSGVRPHFVFGGIFLSVLSGLASKCVHFGDGGQTFIS